MNKKRLLKLADLLEADAKNKKGIKFDLGIWGSALGDEQGVSVSCGTTACAMGLAVVSGAFARAGLRNYHGARSRVLSPAMPGGRLGIGAAISLFSISEEQAAFLFYDDSYPHTKRTGAIGERFVAKRIRDFVAGKVQPSKD